MEEDEEIYQSGWVPDYPDFREYTEEYEGVKLLLEKTSVKPIDQAAGIRLPGSVDLRKWCSPIENQGAIGSCTANAGAGVKEPPAFCYSFAQNYQTI